MAYMYLYNQQKKKRAERYREKRMNSMKEGILLLMSGFVIFIFNPLEAKRGSFFNLFDAIRGDSFGLPKPFADFLLVFGRTVSAAGLLLVLCGYVRGVVVVPLVRPIVRAVSSHGFD